MEKKFENLGKLHRVKCEWCEITMGCNCWEAMKKISKATFSCCALDAKLLIF